MLNFQTSYELEKEQIPNISSPQNLIISGNLPTIERGCKRQRRSASAKEDVHDHEGSLTEHKLRKIKHREIERQRRQEMANLHASLRSLLPVEYIKGKRSISDHMQGTVNYIKHMENKIKELRLQKENLMKITDLRNGVSEIFRAKNYSHCHLSITANTCRDGLEILIRSHPTKNDIVFPLSGVIKKLIVEGLDVISCVSTRNYETTFYRILNKVRNPSCIDITALRQKLADVISQYSASE